MSLVTPVVFHRFFKMVIFWKTMKKGHKFKLILYVLAVLTIAICISCTGETFSKGKAESFTSLCLSPPCCRSLILKSSTICWKLQKAMPRKGKELNVTFLVILSASWDSPGIPWRVRTLVLYSPNCCKDNQTSRSLHSRRRLLFHWFDF